MYHTHLQKKEPFELDFEACIYIGNELYLFMKLYAYYSVSHYVLFSFHVDTDAFFKLFTTAFTRISGKRYESFEDMERAVFYSLRETFPEETKRNLDGHCKCSLTQLEAINELEEIYLLLRDCSPAVVSCVSGDTINRRTSNAGIKELINLFCRLEENNRSTTAEVVRLITRFCILTYQNDWRSKLSRKAKLLHHKIKEKFEY